MTRLHKITAIRVAPTEPKADWLTMRCMDGRAKWSPESRVLSLKMDVFNDQAHDKWLDFFASKPDLFRLEVDCQSESAPEMVTTNFFSISSEATLEMRSATIRPKARSTTCYYLRAIAEQDVAGNSR